MTGRITKWAFFSCFCLFKVSNVALRIGKFAYATPPAAGLELRQRRNASGRMKKWQAPPRLVSAHSYIYFLAAENEKFHEENPPIGELRGFGLHLWPLSVKKHIKKLRERDLLRGPRGPPGSQVFSTAAFVRLLPRGESHTWWNVSAFSYILTFRVALHGLRHNLPLLVSRNDYVLKHLSGSSWVEVMERTVKNEWLWSRTALYWDVSFLPCPAFLCKSDMSFLKFPRGTL